jgi:hypothetical protein
MKRNLAEHILSVVLVTLLLMTLVFVTGEKQISPSAGEAQDLVSQSVIDPGNALHRALLKDALNLYYPANHARADSLLDAIDGSQTVDLFKDMQRAHLRERLTFAKFMQLLLMYAKFILVYVLVMGFTFYGVQTLAVWRFIRRKQVEGIPYEKPAQNKNRAVSVFSAKLTQWAHWLARKPGKIAVQFILMSPAYVLAYSIKSDFDEGSLIFMILLATVSNGLLLLYSNKFYAFLVAESRKGYVLTAIVKNLNNSYALNAPDGIRLRRMLAIRKRFDNHVFNHIYMNAGRQYLATLKEQASFLITGLIIIEMALNIHGYLNYELLQQLLYRNLDIVFIIILFIFYVVKATDILIDWQIYRRNKVYENLG